MKYTKLGKSDLNVFRICIGCMGFGDSSNGQHGWTLDEPATREIIKYGLEQGINFYDTAIAYQIGKIKCSENFAAYNRLGSYGTYDFDGSKFSFCNRSSF